MYPPGKPLDVLARRKIAERGRYPAIDVLKSVSRTLPAALDAGQNHARLTARRVLSTFQDIEEMVRLGAYRAGSSPEADHAIALAPHIEALLNQDRQERSSSAESFAAFEHLLNPSHEEVGHEDAL